MAIAAIPTRFNGIQFRSRLEARWAAMFTACGWAYQYEPRDFDGYIPDFRIGKRFLEVKPATKFPVADAKKMMGAIDLYENRDEVGWLNLLRESPSTQSNLPFARAIGWNIDSDEEAECDIVVIVRTGRWGEDGFRLLHYVPRYRQFTTGVWEIVDGRPIHPLDDVVFDDGEAIDQAWAQACNLTQWRGSMART